MITPPRHEVSAVSPSEILETAGSVLVVDWPSTDVPESLARAGFQVVVQGGPGPGDYSTYEFNDSGDVISRAVGHAPERADLIYSYRPFSELPGIIASAKTLNATAIWTQSGLSAAGVRDPRGCWLSIDEQPAARTLVEGAGLKHVFHPYIGDVAREVRASR